MLMLGGLAVWDLKGGCHKRFREINEITNEKLYKKSSRKLNERNVVLY